MTDEDMLSLLKIVCGMIIGGLLVYFISEESWHTLAIEHQAAQYNPTSGKFEWLK